MIVSTNAEAHSENQRRLDELPGEVRVFKAKDWTEKSKTEGPLTLEVEKVGFWEVFFFNYGNWMGFGKIFMKYLLLFYKCLLHVFFSRKSTRLFLMLPFWAKA